jgi:hypothetical protein
MVEKKLTEKEIQEAKDSLLGIKIWFIVEAVLYGIATLTFMILAIVIPVVLDMTTGEPVASWASAGGFLFGFIIVGALLALFLVALFSLIKRKSYSFPFSMAMLIVSMLWVPIGTIVGAILLIKFNTELVKKYLGFNR